MIKLESATHVVAIKRFKLVLHFACVYLPIRSLNTQNIYWETCIQGSEALTPKLIQITTPFIILPKEKKTTPLINHSPFTTSINHSALLFSIQSSIISACELQLLSRLNSQKQFTHRFITKVFLSNFILLLLTKILNSLLYGCMCTSGLTNTHTEDSQWNRSNNTQ